MSIFGKYESYDKLPSTLRALTFTIFLHDCKVIEGLDPLRDSDKIMERFNKLFKGRDEQD